jgi:hypothetical protein
VTSFIGVENHFQQCVSYSVWWSVLLVLNAIFNNMSGITFNLVVSFIGV